jgi:DNA-binding response OmpR family regulator
MKKGPFSDTKIVFVEPQRDTRSAVRDGLRARGFDDIVATSNMGQLEDLVGESLIDLVICDAEVDNEGFSSFMNLVRQGGHGPNPYLVTVATTEVTTESNVKRVVDAGIDNILVKPFSLGALLDRISALVHWRKSFVVSANYIGPDRRLRPRQEVCLPLIEVPNTLKERFDGTYNEARILEEISNINEKVDLQRTTQDAVLINEIVRQIVPHYETGPADDSILIHLNHLLRAAHDISRRLKYAGDTHVADLCKSLIPITEKVLANHVAPDKKDIRLL